MQSLRRKPGKKQRNRLQSPGQQNRLQQNRMQQNRQLQNRQLQNRLRCLEDRRPNLLLDRPLWHRVARLPNRPRPVQEIGQLHNPASHKHPATPLPSVCAPSVKRQKNWPVNGLKKPVTDFLARQSRLKVARNSVLLMRSLRHRQKNANLLFANLLFASQPHGRQPDRLSLSTRHHLHLLAMSQCALHRLHALLIARFNQM